MTRRSHLAAVERLERALSEARNDYREQREHNRALVQIIADMKREGFAAPPAPAPRETDIVTEAISVASNGDRRLWAHLRREALRLKTEGKEPEEIAKLLLQPEEEEGVA